MREKLVSGSVGGKKRKTKTDKKTKIDFSMMIIFFWL